MNPDSTYPIVIYPIKLNAKSPDINSSNEIKFKIKNVSDGIVSLSNIFIPESFYTVKLPLKVNAGETVEASIKLTDSGLSTNFENSFTIVADNGSKYRFTIPVEKTE